MKLAGCEFKTACDVHDLCYGKCDRSLVGECEYRKCQKDGEHYEKQICYEPPLLTNILEAKNRRSICDKKFFADIDSRNNKPICTVFAGIYWLGVRGLGGDYFAGGQVSAALPFMQKRNLNVMNKFLESASEKELEQFLDQIKTETTADIAKPIYYNKDRGLIN